MPSARSICTRALRKMGAVGQGDIISANDMSEMFEILNDMMDGWAADKLTIQVTERALFNLTSGVGGYTLGVGGTFNRVRPNTLDKVSIVTTASGRDLEVPIDVLDLAQYQGLAVKSTPGALPTKVYRDFAQPLMNVTFWPIPNVAGVRAALYCPLALTEFATLDTIYTFAPGFRRTIEYCLAVEAAPDFEREPSQIVMQKAAEYLGEIRAVSAAIQSEIIAVDDALRTGGGRGFNWRTGV